MAYTRQYLIHKIYDKIASFIVQYLSLPYVCTSHLLIIMMLLQSSLKTNLDKFMLRTVQVYENLLKYDVFCDSSEDNLNLQKVRYILWDMVCVARHMCGTYSTQAVRAHIAGVFYECQSCQYESVLLQQNMCVRFNTFIY